MSASLHLPEPQLAVRCRGMTKRYGQLTAVDSVDLDLMHGECFGLLGPNGAGKTTAIEILEGLTQPDAGQIEVLGRRWGTGDDRALRERLGVQLQDNQLVDKLTVEEVVILFRSLYAKGRDPDDVIAELELENKRHDQFHKLSGGQKQRLTLACALVCEPEMLFLDEPTTGLDPQARQQVWRIVRDYRTSGGTVLMTTHYMEEAAQLCDRLAIMDHGRVIALGTPDELIASLNAKQIVEFVPDAPPLTEHSELLRSATRRGDWWVLHTDETSDTLNRLLDELKRQGRSLIKLRTHQPTLDDVFLHHTGKALRDA